MLRQPSEYSHDRVEYRKPQHQRRNYHDYYRSTFDGTQYRYRRYRKSQQLRTAVSHEYLRGIEIVRQESKRRARYSHHCQRRHILPVDICDVSYTERGYRCDTCSQSVESVYQIHSIRDSYQPQYRDDETCHVTERHIARTEVIRDELDPDSHDIHHCGAYYLPAQLYQRLQILQIIDQTEHVYQSASGHNARYPFVFECKDHKCGHYPEIYSDAPESRHRLFMHASFILRDVHRTYFRRDLYRRRRNCRCHDKGDQKRPP